MTKNKLIAFGIIFLLAIALIVIGTLMSKKDNGDNVTTNEVGTPNKKDNPFSENSTGEIPNQVKSDENGIGNIYDIIKEADKQETLTHSALKYKIKMPTADLKDLIVEEKEENNIISTGFYYQGETTKAMVFSINNYPIREWDNLNGAIDDVKLGETPIRVLTYSLASDNPFEPNSEDSKKYLAYVEKVPQYIKTFKLNKKET